MLAALQRGVKGGKWHSLIDKVSRLETLGLGWAQVERNAGAAGVDKDERGAIRARAGLLPGLTGGSAAGRELSAAAGKTGVHT